MLWKSRRIRMQWEGAILLGGQRSYTLLAQQQFSHAAKSRGWQHGGKKITIFNSFLQLASSLYFWLLNSLFCFTFQARITLWLTPYKQNDRCQHKALLHWKYLSKTAPAALGKFSECAKWFAIAQPQNWERTLRSSAGNSRGEDRGAEVRTASSTSRTTYCKGSRLFHCT